MKKQLSKSKYVIYFAISAAATLLINIIFLVLPKFWSQMMLGKIKFSLLPTFQDTMWLIFFMGILLIFERIRSIKKEDIHMERNYLPEDFQTIIDDEVLTKIIRKSKDISSQSDAVLPYMILQISLQFRTNNSISITTDFLSKQIDLFLHSIELNYSKLKYIIWVIPSIGFMGTVYGIGLAVVELGAGNLSDPALLTKMASHLGVAFNTTLLALILSVILQFFVQQIESKEESLINNFGKYILDNLINKLVEKR